MTDRDGVAVLAGRNDLELKAAPRLTPADTFMVRVDAKQDMALLPLDGSFMVDTYRASRGIFWSGYSNERDHIHAWGTTAQGVYKLGDTVQYKVYLRNQNNLTLEPVTAALRLSAGHRRSHGQDRALRTQCHPLGIRRLRGFFPCAARRRGGLVCLRPQGRARPRWR